MGGWLKKPNHGEVSDRKEEASTKAKIVVGVPTGTNNGAVPRKILMKFVMVILAVVFSINGSGDGSADSHLAQVTLR